MEEYTEQMHARNLIGMLEEDGNCPAGSLYSYLEGPKYIKSPYKNRPCIICRDFVSCKDNYEQCPCGYFKTCKEARKVSWISLEEKGYI